ncbi:Uncharacterized protein SCF082_LOCUS36423 [Durusdinium trenchii]|uniref:Uncharacterized protein n=1 Tax=Durusdinium trenchii TaxID=1381693 RepID=A0ABP0PG14_9DINO
MVKRELPNAFDAGPRAKTVKSCPSTAVWAAKTYEQAKTFDVDVGDHPVQMLLDKFKAPLYEPIQTWLEQLMPNFPNPKDYKFPADVEDIVDVPLLCILFQRPPDGLPLYHLWVAVAKDIWHRGYECWREVLEVKGVGVSRVVFSELEKSHHLWNQILTVDEKKQELFIDRVQFIHSVATRRAGKAASVRMSLQEWNSECDKMCFAQHVLGEMAACVDDLGQPLFHDSVLSSARNRAMEGDYNAEAESFLSTLDSSFTMEQTSLYTEHAPKRVDRTKERVDKADEGIQTLTAEARKAQYDADQLALARDIAQIGTLYREVAKTESAARTARITHLRGQNCIGAALVSEFMNSNMSVHAGTCREQISLAERFLARFHQCPVVVWCDLMKCGRLTGTEVHDFCEVLATIIKRNPGKTAAIVVAPFLISEKVAGYRGELRRWEDKFDAKGFKLQSISIRCATPTGKRKVPLHFDGWVLMLDGVENIFSSCQLIQDRSNRGELPWAPEASYIVPVASKDALPHASEGVRSLSDVQEAAQLLAGETMPVSLLSALFAKSQINSDTCALINLTTYDGWVERACKKWSEVGAPAMSFKSLSLTKTLATAEYVEKSLALQLMEEWKSGQHKTLGPVRAYEPKPPEPVGKDVDPAKFPLRLVKLDYDSSPSAKGWQKFRVSLPPAVRARHVDDPVFGEAWKDLLRDFDAKYGAQSQEDAKAALALAAKKEEEDSKAIVEPWTGEPETLDELTDRYIIEAKFVGRAVGTTLVIVQAKGRDGSYHQAVENQRYKLFVAPWLLCLVRNVFHFEVSLFIGPGVLD